MTKVYTQEDVLRFIEDTIQKIVQMIKETHEKAESYLTDPSENGFRAYWFHKGVTVGLNEAVSILGRESKRQIEEAVELKPCPCCGSTRIHVIAPDEGCYCWDCRLTMHCHNWRERWNKRVVE